MSDTGKPAAKKTMTAAEKQKAKLEKMTEENRELKASLGILQQRLEALEKYQQPEVIEEEADEDVIEEEEPVEEKTIPAVSATPIPGAPVVVPSPWGDVTIVHLKDNAPGLTTHIQLSNYMIDMARFGETRTLTVQQFEELVGRYRRWFDDGVIAVGKDSEYYAKRNNLKTVGDYLITPAFMANLGRASMATIEDVFSKIGDLHKMNIVEYWKRKMIEGDKQFCDINKVQRLNAMTGGAFDYELKEMTKSK